MSTDAELCERLTVANERLVDALLMFESEDARLSHLAEVIDELAGALRAIDALGAKLDRRHGCRPASRCHTSLIGTARARWCSPGRGSTGA